MNKILPKNPSLIPEHANRVFKGKIFDVYQWQQEMFDGSFETFEMLRRPDTLSILAIKEGKIVTLEEEQPGIGRFYGLPGGRHDNKDETEVQAAQRELKEETGMTFNNWRLINVMQPNSKIEQFVYTFLATDFINQTEQTLEAGEKVTVRLLDFEQVLKLADDPNTRFLPKELLEAGGSISGLLNLPEFPRN